MVLFGYFQQNVVGADWKRGTMASKMENGEGSLTVESTGCGLCNKMAEVAKIAVCTVLVLVGGLCLLAITLYLAFYVVSSVILVLKTWLPPPVHPKM